LTLRDEVTELLRDLIRLDTVNPPGNETRAATVLQEYLARNGVAVCKFFLHVSRNEQKRRFLERLENPDKNWKFSANDAKERGHWKDYMDAYEDTIRQTATKYAPWYVVPADNKWFTRVVVASAVIDALASLDLAYPKVDEKKLAELKVAREALVGKAAKAAKA